MSAPANSSTGDRVTVYIDLTRHGYKTGARLLTPTLPYAEVMAGAMTEVAHGIGLLGIRNIEVGWPEVDGWMAVTVSAADAPAVKIAYASPPAAQIAEFEAFKRAGDAWKDARNRLSVSVLSIDYASVAVEAYATTNRRSLLRRVVDRVRGWLR